MPALCKRFRPRVLLLLACMGFIALAAVGAAVLWLRTADLKPFLEREASDRLQRRVTIGAFRLALGDPLTIEINDLHIANPSWGHEPDLVRVGHLFARVDLGALLHGLLRYETLRIEDVAIALERNEAGLGNWKFPGAGLGGGVAVVPKNRAQFPTLLDFAAARGLVTFRTSSGKLLRMAIDQLSAQSAGDQAPIALQGEGAYNDVPVRLDASTQSAAVMRNAGVPFGARIKLSGDDADASFDGTMQEPLDFDGVRGSLSLEARNLDSLLKLFGTDATAALPLTATGSLKRDGNDWSWSGMSGDLAANAFTGSVALKEGGRGEPDDISVDSDFKQLDVDAVLAAVGEGKADRNVRNLPLKLDLSGINVAVRLSAGALVVASNHLSDARLDGRLAGGDVKVKTIQFGLAGASVTASGSLEQGEQGGHLMVAAQLAKAEAAQLAKLLGAEGNEIRGRVHGGATLEMTGQTVGEALKTSRGSALMAMDDGDVTRDLIERVSADLRNLFRSGEGRVPIDCLAAVLTQKNGAGVASLRIDSQEAMIVGTGGVDFRQGRLDLTVKSERDTTGFFALDIPIGIHGSFANLKADPLSNDDAHPVDAATVATTARALPASLRQLVDDNVCAQ